MSDEVLSIRRARKADSRAIAELFLIASDGLAAYIWEQVAEPGETLLDTGTRRYAREEGNWSYWHCLVATVEGRVVGMAHAYPMFVDPNAEPEDDPILRPYAELENDGSLYVAGIAVYPENRGRGVGQRLLSVLFAEAKERRMPRVSLICFEQNAGALDLYTRTGFIETDRRPLVPHRTLKYASGDALLLVKPLDSA